MAFLFSQVTVTAGNDKVSFLVGGIPREYHDLEDWDKFDDFLKYINKETEVLVHADAYLYGEGETSVMPYSDILWFSSRLEFGSSFLTDYCDNIETLLGYRKNCLEWRWNEMNKFEAEQKNVQRMKDNYPPGTRIMLLQMGDDPRPIEPNTRGTVKAVDDMGTLHCNFDNGRSLGIVPDEDSFRRLTEQELSEGQTKAEPEDFSMKMQ